MGSVTPFIDLTGKVAIVTGAASGIGRAACIRYAQVGAAVMCADINGDGAKQTAETVRSGLPSGGQSQGFIGTRHALHYKKKPALTEGREGGSGWTWILVTE